ncbi:MAG: cysteine synthase family protein [Deltaproteobacteria bacterium]|nr:cysteine synthase family protein [Deltaproteobacteria bacterium]
MNEPSKTPGGTPLVALDGIYAKLECTNPCGSIKDRIAKYILDESERTGALRPGMTIVEATSGNTGISLTYYARQKGYAVRVVMPEDMTQERQEIIRSFGAELLLCRAGDFAEAAAIRDRLAAEHGYFNPDQFSNPLNVECHDRTTGQELLAQMEEHAPRVDAFVAGIGTGGTLMGVGRALRRRYPDLRLVAVEPAESPVLSGGSAGPHGIQGIGDGFIPPIAKDPSGGPSKLIDEVICVGSEAARLASLEIAERHGYCVGISSGANYLAARALAERFRTVVTVFADGYYKYQSRGLSCRDGRCLYHDDRSLIFRATPPAA